MTRPAESSLLVQQLEQLLLATLRDSETQQAAGGETGSLGGAGAGSSHSVRQHGQRGNAAADTDAQQQLSSSGGCAAAAIVAAAAARWYCQLLLSEKLLLTGASWGVVAEGLLAFSSVGPLEVGVYCEHILTSHFTACQTPHMLTCYKPHMSYASALRTR